MTSAVAPAAVDADDFAKWVGRTERRADRVTPVPLAALAATLDRDDPPPAEGTAIPPLRHWLYFLPLAPTRELGPDGHPKRGGFLPPVPLPRRMWAGGRLEFRAPLCVGDAIERTSTIASVETKHGRSGTLVFVLVRHEISARGGPAIVEEHDIVYREAPHAGDAPAAKKAVPPGAEWTREVVPGDVLLFRYSALTFNGHRIHYDRRYVTTEEGYPGLVVHGPLIATLLADLARDHVAPAPLATFSFRAVSPLFDTAPFTVCGRREPDGAVRLWAQDAGGSLAMEASATVR